MEREGDLRSRMGFLEKAPDVATPASLLDDRPSFLVELFGRRLCGIVTEMHRAMYGSKPIKVYTVISDEVLDKSGSYTDPDNKSTYHIAGNADIIPNERIHAYISRRQKTIKPIRRSPELDIETRAHFLLWYSNLSHRL